MRCTCSSVLEWGTSNQGDHDGPRPPYEMVVLEENGRTAFVYIEGSAGTYERWDIPRAIWELKCRREGKWDSGDLAV